MSNGSKLIDVADLIMGQSPPSETYNEEGIGLPFYQGKSDFGATYPMPRIFCSEPLRIAEPGDILMSVRAPVGATNLCKERSCIGRGLTAIRPHAVDRDFLYFNLKHIEPYLDSLGSGAIFKAINKHQLSQATVNEVGFDSPEQQRIAQVLSTVQEAIAQQERLIRTTTELKQALMQKLFTEGLRGEALKETEIGRVPESWEVVSLDDVMSCHDGKRKPVTQSDRIPGPYPYYGASGVTDHVEGYLFDGDYLLIAEDGENLASRKLPIAFIARGKFWVNNHAHVLSMKRGNLDFYEQYIAQMEIKDYLSGTTRPKLNKGLMMTIKLPWPSVSEQNEIATALTACDTKLHTAERKRNALQDLFRTLLHELMTGKVRVGDKALANA